MPEIILTQNKTAIVDEDDFVHINKVKWCYRQGYAIRGVNLGIINGKKKILTISMHRYINNTPNDLDTDHINGNKLDNRKENLRSISRKENVKKKHFYNKKDKSSEYRGVSLHNKKWQANIKVDKKFIYLGIYKDEKLAAMAYNLAAINYFGKFAYLNIVSYS